MELPSWIPEFIQAWIHLVIEWGSHELVLPYVVALLLFVLGAIGIWFKSHWATIPHELGHAFVALILGKKIGGININQDTSGDTRTLEYKPANPAVALLTSPFRWLRGILVSFAGYPAPFLLSFVLVYLWSHELTRLALMFVLFLLVFTLFYSTNLFGFGMVALGIAITGILIWLLDYPWVHEVFIVLLAGGMASGGVRGTWEAWRVYHQDRQTSKERWDDPEFEPQHSDARALTKVTLLPQAIWLSIFTLVGTGISLWTLVELASAYSA